MLSCEAVIFLASSLGMLRLPEAMVDKEHESRSELSVMSEDLVLVCFDCSALLRWKRRHSWKNVAHLYRATPGFKKVVG